MVGALSMLFFCPARIWGRALAKVCLCVLLSASGCCLLVAQAARPIYADSGVSGSFSDDAAHSPAAANDAGQPAPPKKASSAALPSESSSRSSAFAVAPSGAVATHPGDAGKFNLKGALIESFNSNLFFDVWRVAFDPFMRYNLSHKPFFHDWFASYGGYDMHRWGDGDDFIVNDVGHPLEGGVFGRIFLIHSPNSQVVIGKNRRYWTSRLKAMAWAAAWSTQLEIGPISETDFGNQGGYTYVPGCGLALSCLNNPKYHKPPTNNTGWTDFVVTPTVGTLWILGEDTIDKYIVSPIAVNHRIFGGRILRSALEPTRSFAAIFSGKFPWQLPAPENNFA